MPWTRAMAPGTVAVMFFASSCTIALMYLYIRMDMAYMNSEVAAAAERVELGEREPGIEAAAAAVSVASPVARGSVGYALYLTCAVSGMVALLLGVCAFPVYWFDDALDGGFRVGYAAHLFWAALAAHTVLHFILLYAWRAVRTLSSMSDTAVLIDENWAARQAAELQQMAALG